MSNNSTTPNPELDTEDNIGLQQDPNAFTREPESEPIPEEEKSR